MRAPPVAVKLTNGVFCSIAASTPRTKRSPTTEPIDPPMKSNSKQATTTGIVSTAPPITIKCVGLAGGLQRLLQPLRILLAVTELQRVDRQHFLPDLVAPFGVQEGVESRAGTDAVVVRALRADVDVLLQVGLVEYRFAGRALEPQPLRHGAPLARVGRLDLRRKEFFEPTHVRDAPVVAPRCGASSPPFALRRVKRGPDLGDELAGDLGNIVARLGGEELNEARSDDDRVRDPRNRSCRRCIANAEADRERHRHVRPNARQHLRHRRHVEMTGAGHALERDAVDVAARDAPHIAHALFGRGRREQEDRVEPGRRAPARRRPRTPRAGSPPRAHRRRPRRARRRRTRPRRGAGRSVRTGSHSPSARPACSRRGHEMSARRRAHGSSRCPWRAPVHRPSGSPGPRPSGRKTAPRVRSRRRRPWPARA